MQLLALLTCFKALTTTATAPGLADPALQSPVEADDRPLGCGWFDSSHELHAGLLVQEHGDNDTLAAELPLRQWLQSQMGGYRCTPAIAG